MWDIIIALVLMYPAVEMAEEWHRNNVAKRLLADMRKHVEQHHHWDAVCGRWVA
jgi:hypothetical protein